MKGSTGKVVLCLGVILLLSVFLVGCGEDRYAGEMQASKLGLAESEENMDEEVREKKEAYSPNPLISDSKDDAPGKAEGQKAKENIKVDEPAPKRIYTAKLWLETRSSKETGAAILSIMEKNQGFLQTQTEEKVVIRVPAGNFEKVVDAIGLLGVLLDKKISTYDVSAQYADVERRLAVARKSRQRLQALLAITEKVKEKVAIIEEIKRLTRLIEAYEQSKGTMDSYIQFSLIEIFLSNPAPRKSGVDTLTPFAWINNLDPHRQSLKNLPVEAVEYALPEGFILFEEEDGYLARSAGGSFIRAGETENEPLGDGKFWLEALRNGMQLKNYKVISEGKEENLFYALFEYQQLKPFYYLLVWEVDDKLVRVMEVYFSDGEEEKLYREKILTQLKTLKLVK
ncbi:MAG: hypothetical protein CVV50_02455 [Spirochaetae bacterium HGW-Spirochaetae-6]|nr:MAG: hypothetical protein CVV50_02455 [Spirochaetae bacterium HGW-Spirochaetae-6]